MSESLQHGRRWNRGSRRERGFTLVEMLVATTITLMMIFAMVEVFKQLGDRVIDSRAMLEVSGRVRSAAAMLERDLTGVTVDMRSWSDRAGGQGYFEYIEGGGSDASPGYAGASLPTNIDAKSNGVDLSKFGLFGDMDDVLMFTAYSPDKPFIGRQVISTLSPPGEKTVQIQSKIAEIIWWTHWNDADGDSRVGLGEVTLHRRALLVRPDLSLVYPAALGSRTRIARFYNANDISANVSGSTLTANSLADLSLRGNRVAHVVNTTISTVTVYDRDNAPLQFDDANALQWRVGEDAVLADVLAFDVRVYDPYAPVVSDGAGGILKPGAQSYNPSSSSSGANAIVGQGAYVDLGYSLGSSSLFNASNTNYRSNIFNRSLQKSFATVVKSPTMGTVLVPASPNQKSLLLSALPGFNGGNNHTAYTFDTWTQAYEHDGVNQDSSSTDTITDEGADGLDNDGSNGVDDPAERETAPPYNRALSGIKVTIRVLEFDTRQVLQTSVASDFVPE